VLLIPIELYVCIGLKGATRHLSRVSCASYTNVLQI